SPPFTLPVPLTVTVAFPPVGALPVTRRGIEMILAEGQVMPGITLSTVVSCIAKPICGAQGTNALPTPTACQARVTASTSREQLPQMSAAVLKVALRQSI